MIKTITDNYIALCIDYRDLAGLGIPSQLTKKDLNAIVRHALISSGKPPWSAMEADLFSLGCTHLLIARNAGEEITCFHFPSSDGLISAVCACRDNFRSSLTYLDGEYLLFVNQSPDSLPAPFCEYGRGEKCSPQLAMHLKEQGKTLIESGATAFLKEKFLHSCSLNS